MLMTSILFGFFIVGVSAYAYLKIDETTWSAAGTPDSEDNTLQSPAARLESGTGQEKMSQLPSDLTMHEWKITGSPNPFVFEIPDDPDLQDAAEQFQWGEITLRELEAQAALGHPLDPESWPPREV